MTEQFTKLFKSTGKKVAGNLKDYLNSYAYKDSSRNKARITLINYNNHWCIWPTAPAFPDFDVIYFDPKKKSWYFFQYFGPREGYKETLIDLSI